RDVRAPYPPARPSATGRRHCRRLLGTARTDRALRPRACHPRRRHQRRGLGRHADRRGHHASCILHPAHHPCRIGGHQLSEPVNAATLAPAGPRASVLGQAVKVRETGLILVIVVLFAIMSFASPYFLTWENMRAMTMAFAVEGIVVVGMTILLISGGIDLSVGSVVAFAMVLAGWLFLQGVDPWVASLIAIRSEEHTS